MSCDLYFEDDIGTALTLKSVSKDRSFSPGYMFFRIFGKERGSLAFGLQPTSDGINQAKQISDALLVWIDQVKE